MSLHATHVEYYLSSEQAELIEAIAWDSDVLCVDYRPPSEDAWPAEISNVPREHETILRITFEDPQNAAEFASKISEELGISGALIDEEIRDWLEYHQPYAQPIHLEHLTILPQSAPSLTEQESNVIYLTPGLGFGTGRHETTKLCLESLTPSRCSGKSVIDFGSGSGILGIAALKMGATHVQFHDYDEQAMRATHDNLKAHGYLEHATGCYSAADLQAADLCCANILFEPLIQLSEVLTQLTHVGGTGVFSGLLAEQSEKFLAHYLSLGWKCIERKDEGDWVAFILERGRVS